MDTEKENVAQGGLELEPSHWQPSSHVRRQRRENFTPPLPLQIKQPCMCVCGVAVSGVQWDVLRVRISDPEEESHMISAQGHGLPQGFRMQPRRH